MTKKQEAQFVRDYEKAIQQMNRQAEQDATKIGELETELAQTKAELYHAKLYYDLRIAERDAARIEFEDVQRCNAVLLTTISATREAWKQEQEKHAKLSEIVRLALTPEQYHLFRGIVEKRP